MKRVAALASLVLAVASPVFAFESGPERVSFIEVYSSEGCSSCPPAEKWVSALDGHTGLWRDFVPVVFHVDYWDNLGWKDPFSSPQFTQRQREYSAAWRSESVYTPGFVLNGKEWRNWAAYDSPPAEASRPSVGVLKVTRVSPTVFDVSFSPGKDAPGKSWTAHASVLGMGLSSNVMAGENNGKILRHDFAALSYARVPLEPAANAFTGKIEIDPVDGDSDRALAVWVTRAGEIEPVQAAGDRLTAEALY